jgi:hypothetical protein
MNAPLKEKEHRIAKTLALVLLVFVLTFADFQAGRFVQDMPSTNDTRWDRFSSLRTALSEAVDVHR